jgi:hypothetical protein
MHEIIISNQNNCFEKRGLEKTLLKTEKRVLTISWCLARCNLEASHFAARFPMQNVTRTTTSRRDACARKRMNNESTNSKLSKYFSQRSWNNYGQSSLVKVTCIFYFVIRIKLQFTFFFVFITIKSRHQYLRKLGFYFKSYLSDIVFLGFNFYYLLKPDTSF